jgi:hypothetical protein
MPKEPIPDDPAVHEETDNPTYADDRMFYKVEKWTRDGTQVDRMLYAGNSLGEGAGDICAVHKAPAADQVDDPPADAGDRSVAAGMSADERRL